MEALEWSVLTLAECAAAPGLNSENSWILGGLPSSSRRRRRGERRGKGGEWRLGEKETAIKVNVGVGGDLKRSRLRRGEAKMYGRGFLQECQ